MQKHRAILGVIALGTLLVPAWPAAAGEAQDALARGLRLFNVGELKPAEKVLSRAVGLLPKGSERAKAYLHLGLAKAYQEKFGSAKRDFVRALTDDALVTIDRERVPPPVRDAFDEARSTVTGTMVLGKGPDGARVEIDGQAKGGLPQSQALVVGEHQVRIIGADGKELVAHKLVVRAGEKYELALPVTEVAAAPSPAVPTPVLPTATTPVSPTSAVALPAVKPPKTPQPVAEPAAAEAAAAKPAVAKPAVAEPAVAEPAVPPADPQVIREPLASLPPLSKEPLALVADDLKGGDAAAGAEGGERWFTTRRVVGVFTLSGGVVLGFLGLGYGLAAKGAEDEFRNARAQGSFEQVLQLARDAQDRARYSNVFLAVGGCLAAAGLVVTLWPGGQDRPSARLVPAPGGALLAMEF